MSNKEKLDTEYRGWQLYRRLFRYVTPHQVAIYGSIIGYIIFAATTPATTWWVGFTVDAITAENYEELRILSPLL